MIINGGQNVITGVGSTSINGGEACVMPTTRAGRRVLEGSDEGRLF